MAKRQKKDRVKRKRFRSNVFHPKVKQPVTFELTKGGHKKLTAVMLTCEVSIGDYVEFTLQHPGVVPTPEAFAAASAGELVT